ncbi:hypothetical protein CSB45_08010 [candidate division KSB3 bacterium]|uniref:Uncharacterized protein n=1 Tax=candidate division KSB3 bacterium TaxID=2044937 RepID=A0A2G6E514_9BACT|nr:MAG: hypothetical protein CSB45_08010 [candidate division KSB3 bacterium]PIE29834.1 MAG: hypothetical protein CSA57_07210 [candidate division KSB3 bacterium]
MIFLVPPLAFCCSIFSHLPSMEATVKTVNIKAQMNSLAVKNRRVTSLHTESRFVLCRPKKKIGKMKLDFSSYDL